jgi:hypothetical protein
MSAPVSTEPRRWVASQYLDDGRWGVLTEDSGIVVSVRSKEGQLSPEDARLIAAAPTMATYIEQKARNGDSEAVKIMEQIHGR